MSRQTVTMAERVKARPIIFGAPMIRAILDGSKTMTRRIVKNVVQSNGHDCIKDWDGLPSALSMAPDDWEINPFGRVGDELWVRETWNQVHSTGGGQWATVANPREISNAKLIYLATHPDGEHPPRWRPSIHMPRWASRLTLRITGIKVERLHDITEADAIAEGCQSHFCSREDTLSCPAGSDARKLAEVLEGGFLTAKSDFIELWKDINGAEAWAVNPFCWVIQFERVV